MDQILIALIVLFLISACMSITYLNELFNSLEPVQTCNSCSVKL